MEIAALHEFAGGEGSSATCGGEVETTHCDSERLKTIERREEFKKQRFVWTNELHEIFIHAFNTLDSKCPDDTQQY